MSGRKPSTKPVRSGSGRPAGDGGMVHSGSQPRLNRGASSRSAAEIDATFNAKEIGEYLAARVFAAQDRYKRWSELTEEQKKKEPSVCMYQGEQRAWGGTRPFNPVKDDFLQLVEMAVDAYKQTHTSPVTQGTDSGDE